MQPPGIQPPEVVQVLVEVDARGRGTEHSLELLSDARALAVRLNGIAGGWQTAAPSEPEPEGADLAVHGCRRLRRLRHARFASWSSEAIASALASQISVGGRLILLPGTPRGEEVAALLAGLLQTTWIPDALTLATTRTGALEISAVLPGGKLSRTFRPTGDRPVVATMRPGVAETRTEKREALQIETIEMDLDQVPMLTTVERFIAADPKTIDLNFADRIVSAGRGAGGPDGVALVAELAAALHASLGASRMAVDLGWAPAARQVGQTGRTVSPDLYVACGISGASHHLLGMRTSKHIIAINPDAKAPIQEVAHLSLQADLRLVVPAILAAVRKRSREATMKSA